MIDMLIKNGYVYKNGIFENLNILIENGKISDILSSDKLPKHSGETVDAEGCYVIPGLTDVHFHGCLGYDFCDGTEDSIDKIAEYEFSQGITAICPATMSLSEDETSRILKNARRWKETKEGRSGYAEIVGIHLEGPFLNPEKSGAQNRTFLKKPSARLLEKFQDDAGGLIRIVTLAPEVEGAVELINELNKQFHFSLGHSLSDYQTAAKAFDAGADHVTHLFNAMTEFSHRATGIAGAAFDNGKCFVEIICDGIHVDPSMVRAAFKLFSEK